MDLVATMRKLHGKSFTRGKFLQFARQHRALDVLQATFSQLYPTYLLGMEVFAVGTAVLNLYMAVEFHSISALAMAVGVTAAFCWGASEMAAVYETSKDVMETWKRSDHVSEECLVSQVSPLMKTCEDPTGLFVLH